MADKTPMTPEGYKALQDELRHIKAVERPKNVRDIEEARAHGDLSENAEYHAAKERQSLLHARMKELEGKLATAEIIDPTKLSGDRVMFGATVVLSDVESGEEAVYKIVGDGETDARNGRISINSPVARALIGRSRDDEVVVTTPKGRRTYEITDVRWE